MKKYDIEKELSQLKPEIVWKNVIEVVDLLCYVETVSKLISLLKKYDTEEYCIAYDEGYYIQKGTLETEKDFEIRKTKFKKQLEAHNLKCDREEEKDAQEYKRLKQKYGEK